MSPLSAQIDMGRVTGTVKDPSGGVVPNAELTLTNEATGIGQSTKSSAGGTYVFQTVPVGVYTLKALAPGFKTYQQTGMEVHIQSTVTADVLFTVGGTTEVMTVTATVPLLQSEEASVGHTMTSSPVNDLPLPARNWLSLAQLAPGSYMVGGPSTTPSGSPGLSIQSNGEEQGQVDFRLNGVNNNLEVFGGTTVAPIPDAIQEFRLQAGNNSAEFGHSTGAVLNAITKSGTNNLHGNGWEFFRNEALNANGFFNNANGVARPMYRQNQFGGTLGGPVYIPKVYNGKNKTFFFVDYQRSDVSQVMSFTDKIPTDLMRSSGFTNLQDLINFNSGSATDALGRKFSLGTVFDPATTRAVGAGATDAITGLKNTSAGTVYVRDPFYNGGLAGKTDFTKDTALLNLIPASRIDPTSVKLLRLLPSPTLANWASGYNYYVVRPTGTDINQYDFRIDHNISSKDSIFGVVSRSTTDGKWAQPFEGVAGGALQLNFQTTQPTWLVAISETHAFSPTLMNEARFGYNRNYNTRVDPNGNKMGVPEQFGIQGIPQIANNGGLPTININGFSAFGSRRYTPTLQLTGAQDYTDNLTKISGNHELKAGFQFTSTKGEITQPAYSRGNVNYSGQFSDIPNKNSNLVGIADFLLLPSASDLSSNGSPVVLGGPNGWNGSNYAGTRYAANYYAGYGQDRWKVTPSLTLTLGLRWEYFAPYNERDGNQANFVMNQNQTTGATYYLAHDGCNSPMASAFTSLLSGYNIQTVCRSGNTVNNAQKTNFAPRLGAAWRVAPKLVVRAGYGIAYGAFSSVGYGGTLGTNYPFQFQVSNPVTNSQTPLPLINGQPTTIANLFAGNNIGDPALVNANNMTLTGKVYDYKTPYTQTINATVQYQFTDRDSIQAGYVATKGRNLDAYGSQNSTSVILPVGVNQTNYLPFPKLARNSQIVTTHAKSNYDSLQVTYEHRFNSGLTLMTNYTLGRCMSNQNKTAMGTARRAEWLPGFGDDEDYTYCGSDARHLAHVVGQYALPVGAGRTLLRNSKGLVNALIGGWQLNYIFTYQSGQPVNVGCATATTSNYGCNANLVPGQDPYAGRNDFTQWLNPAAFSNPPAATSIGQTDFAPLGSKGNQVRGPHYTNLDASMFKQFATTEKTKLEFRAEFFNVLNFQQWSNPGSLNFNNPSNFAKITGTRGPARIGQLALKFYF